MKSNLVFLGVLLLILTGCAQLPFELGATARRATAIQTEVPTQAPTAVATSVQTPTPEVPIILRVWVPPEFEPTADTPAGKLLKERIDAFESRRPEIQVEVRVKSREGPGGLFDALSTASAAAQGAIPDLIALPQPVYQTAGLKGLLRPIDDITNAMDEPDWYDYARQLARIQNSVFGLPFAGDALVQVFRPAQIESPAVEWEASLELGLPMAFAAADPQALFSLAMYEASGGATLDDQGRPTLENDALAKTLTYFQMAEEAGVMPVWLAQNQSDIQVWDALKQNRADTMITWATHFLNENLEDTNLAAIPTPEGEPFSLASGWVWAVAASEPERRALAAELANFLVESEFLAGWTQEAGFLPPRPSALAAWDIPEQRAALEAISASARILPTGDIMSVLGPILQDATIKVLQRQLDPLTAAQEAINRLGNP